VPDSGQGMGVIHDPGDGRVGNRVASDETGGAAQILPRPGTRGRTLRSSPTRGQ